MDRSKEQMESLLERYRPLVRACARQYFPDMARDEDLFQCGMIGLWEAALRWNGQGAFSSYARRSVLNNMCDYLRAEQRARLIHRRAREEAQFCRPRPGSGDLSRRIRAAWPANSRERYVLLALSHGVSRQACAAALGVSVRTIRRTALRAITGLDIAP